MSRRMTFLEHFGELKTCLKRILITILSMFIFFFSFGFDLVKIGGITIGYPYPTLDNSFSALIFREIWNYLVPAYTNGVAVYPYASLGGGMMALIYMSFALAIIFSMPIILWQLGKFVEPALKKKEKRVIIRTTIPATLLFLSGCLFAFFAIIPFMVRFLLNVIVGLDAQALITVDDFMKFVIQFCLAFGLVFELPVLMYGLSRMGLVHSSSWLKNWRWAFFLMILFGGLITPDGSGITQMMIAVPMLFLYFLGYFSARHFEKKNKQT